MTPRSTALIDQARQLKARGMTHSAIARSIGRTKRSIVRMLQPRHSALSQQCQICGASARQIQRHHLDYLDNITVDLCVACHRGQHARTARAKWLAMDPSERAWVRIAAEILSNRNLWQLDAGKRRSMIIGLRATDHPLTAAALLKLNPPNGVSR